MSIIHTSESDFDKDVLKSNIPVLVDFWAQWCAPCHAIAPVLEELAKQYEGKIKIVKLNVDDFPNTSMSYGIMSIPNMKIFINGAVVDEIVGAVPRASLEEKIRTHLL